MPIAPEAMQVLLAYPWPGNIRETENVIERACVTTRTGPIQIENLLPNCLESPSAEMTRSIDLSKPLAEYLIPPSPRSSKRTFTRHWNRPTGTLVGVQCFVACPDGP